MHLDRAVPGRFRPEAVFRPARVAVLGATSPAGAQVLANLRDGGFQGEISATALPAATDLAIICPGAGPTPDVFAALARAGCFAAVLIGMADGMGPGGLRALARETGVRVLGPGSFGIAVPAIGLNATSGHLRPRPGRVALVSQSAALCRAVLDWAEPNGVGFSHIVGIGGNDDIGFAPVLDWLSRDPGTGPILLDIRRIKDARAFLSAARAAARLRPTVAIRAGGLLHDPTGASDAAMVTALRRCGVLSVSRLDDLLSAAETLARARPVRNETLAIVTNAIGPAQLAADALVRDGLAPTRLEEPTKAVLRLAVPGAFAEAGPRTDAGDLIYAGIDQPAKLAEAAALLSGATEVGGVLVVHAPTGRADAAGMAAIAAAAAGMHAPLLVCAMGETTGAAHRRILAAAQVPVFASPEAAVRGFLHLVQDARNRAAARELPPGLVLDVRPDQDAVRRLLASARDGALEGAEALAVLAAYGLRSRDDHLAASMRVRVTQDPWFGTIITLDAEAASAVDLPPLNLVLARALIRRARIAASAAYVEALADLLVRISQLVVDVGSLATLEVGVLPDGQGVSATVAALTLRAPDQPPARLAIPPYPAELAVPFQAGPELLTLRPIRPEDAEAHRAFFSRLAPEDVRFRFFHAMRELSVEQIARMTQVDYEREIAFVAVRSPGRGRPDETVGVARLVRDGIADEAEFAVVVEPSMKGRGVARRLMECLFAWAVAQGIGTVVGQVLPDNRPMLEFAHRLGFTAHRRPDQSDVIELRLSLSG